MSTSIVEPRPGIDTGRVVVSVAVENFDDRQRASRGEIPASAVRRASTEALVDSGATFFCLPAPLIAQLGLVFRRERETKTIHGPCMLHIFGIATIEVEGRTCDVEVMELPEGRQALLGQVPLETLGFWVDLTNRRLVGNPEHDRRWMPEVYRARAWEAYHLIGFRLTPFRLITIVGGILVLVGVSVALNIAFDQRSHRIQAILSSQNELERRIETSRKLIAAYRFDDARSQLLQIRSEARAARELESLAASAELELTNLGNAEAEFSRLRKQGWLVIDGLIRPPAEARRIEIEREAARVQSLAEEHADHAVFHDPNRKFPYWSNQRTYHLTRDEALRALADQFSRSPKWVEKWMGDSNELTKIHYCLSKVWLIEEGFFKP